MPLQLAPWGNFQFLDGNGNPAAGYQLFVYAGRTPTKQDTYKDQAGVAKHTNPIILNANGLPPAPIFIDTALAYKFVLALDVDLDPPTAPLYTVDQVTVGLELPNTAAVEWVAGDTPSYIGATQFSVPGDQRTTYHVGRRVKCVTNAGTLYGTITGVSFSTVTTVTVAFDSGSLDATLSAVYYGFLSASGSSWPGGYSSGVNTVLQGSLTMPAASSFTLFPAGFVMPFAGSLAPPTGYLLCNGAAVSRSTYAALFAAIGTVFGAGDGATTFNVPNIADLASGVKYIIRIA